MALEYKYDTFEDFNELRVAKPKLAEILSSEFYDGDWQGEDIYVYPDVKNYALSELIDGYYQISTYPLYQHLKNSTLPDFLEYINLNKLGRDLASDLDRYIFVTKSGIVVQTPVGFW